MVEIKANNIGPFEELSFHNSKNKISWAIYARNGSGKTYLSRCFALLSSQEADEKITRLMLRKGSGKANFSFSTDKGKSSFDIKNESISYSSNLDRIFYVFNSDYVEENLYKKNYQLDGKIDGVILGKENIALDKATEEKNSLLNDLKINYDDIEIRIKSRKRELRDNGVSQALTEYREITYDEIKRIIDQVSEEEYNTKLLELQRISNLPDDYPEIPVLSIKCEESQFTSIDEIIKKEFSLRSFDEDFASYVRDNIDFIESGLSLSKDSVCPFCKTKYSDEAIRIVHLYEDYLNNEQAKVIKELHGKTEELGEARRILEGLRRDVLNAERNVTKAKQYFSVNEIDLDAIEEKIDLLLSSIDEYNNLIKDKIEDLKISLEPTCNIHNQLKELLNEVEKINDYLITVNKTIKNANSVARQIKREVCVELRKKLCIELKELNQKEKDIRKALETKENEILELKSNSQSSKRDIVAENLKNYIDSTFHGKYSFDTESFEISLGKDNIGEDAKFILSDGEKSALAFIHYLSSVHTVVDREKDYEKIIFVMDDPVSSMDYLYLYEMMSNIRFLPDKLGIKQYKLIVMSHNLEFYSAIVRNNIVEHKYKISNSQMEKFDEKLIMPYEFHLKDICDYNSGKNIGNRAHTIPNSIRHILETVCQFEGLGPGSKAIRTLLNDNDEFKKPGYVYSMIEDLSHGKMRVEESYSEDQIKMVCQAVISFLQRKYEHQLDKFDI